MKVKSYAVFGGNVYIMLSSQTKLYQVKYYRDSNTKKIILYQVGRKYVKIGSELFNEITKIHNELLFNEIDKILEKKESGKNE